MATHSIRLAQDQNFSVHFDGVKTNGSTVQKNKGGLRGRKALNDISNSKNVIPIGEDLGVSKKATQITVGGKPQISGKKAQVSGKKAQVSGRKALGDLTNSVKPFGGGQQQQGSKKKGPEKKSSIAVAENEDENFLYSIAEEGFLHNHEECIKSQKRAMDLHQFLETVGLGGKRPIGLDEDVSCKSVSPLPKNSKDEDPFMLFGMEEEMPVPPMIEDSEDEDPFMLFGMPMIEERPHKLSSSPICGSPTSPYMEDWDDYCSFILADESNVILSISAETKCE